MIAHLNRAFRSRRHRHGDVAGAGAARNCRCPARSRPIAPSIPIPAKNSANARMAGDRWRHRSRDDGGDLSGRRPRWSANALTPTVRRAPATSYRSVMRAANGEIERSDFDTFNPLYYPFLAQPVTSDMQPGACLNRRALDLATLIGGGSITTWLWSDSGMVGVILQGDGEEKVTRSGRHLRCAAGAYRSRFEQNLSARARRCS